MGAWEPYLPTRLKALQFINVLPRVDCFREFI